MPHAEVVQNEAFLRFRHALIALLKHFRGRIEVTKVTFERMGCGDRKLQVILIGLCKDIAMLFGELATVVDGFFDVVLHVKLEQIVLPHEHV